MTLVDARGDAARRANRTRRVMGAVDTLRGMAPFHKEDVRTIVADFLEPFGGPVADLHGPDGASARTFVGRGLTVISAEDGRFLDRTGLDRDLVFDALDHMAREAGYELHPGDFANILPRCKTAFFDPCGPYLAPTSEMVRRMVAADLVAFAVTVELSRIEGGKGKGEAHYLRWAEVGLSVDAPGYIVAKCHRYRGTANIPMAVFLVRRERPGRLARLPVERTHDEEMEVANWQVATGFLARRRAGHYSPKHFVWFGEALVRYSKLTEPQQQALAIDEYRRLNRGNAL